MQGPLRLTSRCRLAGTSPGGWARGTSSPSFLKWLAVVESRSSFPCRLWAGDRSQLPRAVLSSLPCVPLRSAIAPHSGFLSLLNLPHLPLRIQEEKTLLLRCPCDQATLAWMTFLCHCHLVSSPSSSCHLRLLPTTDRISRNAGQAAPWTPHPAWMLTTNGCLRESQRVLKDEKIT